MMTEFDPAVMDARTMFEELAYRVYAMARLGGARPENLDNADQFEARYAAQYPSFRGPL